MRRLGLDHRATIVLLSDHGEAFQEHGLRGHSRLYAPVTRIMSERDRMELFEFQRDPLELRDISARRPIVVDELAEIVARWRQAVGVRGRPEIAPSPLDEETSEDLRALGYLQ